MLVVSYCHQIKVDNGRPFNLAASPWGYIWDIYQPSSLFSCNPWNGRIPFYTEHFTNYILQFCDPFNNWQLISFAADKLSVAYRLNDSIFFRISDIFWCYKDAIISTRFWTAPSSSVSNKDSVPCFLTWVEVLFCSYHSKKWVSFFLSVWSLNIPHTSNELFLQGLLNDVSAVKININQIWKGLENGIAELYISIVYFG